METKRLNLPKNPINKKDSYQSFLLWNNLQGTMNWDNPEHVNLLKQWDSGVKTFEPFEFMPISPSNPNFNH